MAIAEINTLVVEEDRYEHGEAAMKEAKPIPLGAQLIAMEIAMVSLLQMMARMQPAAAQLVAATMLDTASLIPEEHFPGVSEKIEQYVETIEAEMTASNELTASSALSTHKDKTTLQ
jgi:hypothetical protein